MMMNRRLERKVCSFLSYFKHCVIKYVDLGIIFLLLIYIVETYYFVNYVKHDRRCQSDKWWRFPIYNNWTIDGSIPRINDSEISNFSSSQKSRIIELMQFPSRPLETQNKLKRDRKLIVYTHPPFNAKKHYDIDEELCGKCEVSFNISRRDQSDAVIYPFLYPSPIIKRSFPTQLYVWMNEEGPPQSFYTAGSRSNLKEFDDVFNLTMTYRRDSDIYNPYSDAHTIREEIKKHKEIEDLNILLSSKTRLAAWVAGDCVAIKGSGFRMRMIAELLELGLEIDVYGFCVLRYLPGSWWNLSKTLSRYKFYFAFENSLHCRDYITEKAWWNAVRSGAVPVIWGPMKYDVEAVLPKDSFIFVEDFSSAEDLVDYLTFLDTNADEYMKYFKWRNDPLPDQIPGRLNGDLEWMTDRITGHCHLCHLLYDDETHEKKHGTRPHRVVSSLYRWWYLEETQTCLTPRTFLEFMIGVWYTTLVFRQVYCKTLTLSSYYVIISGLIVLLILLRRKYRQWRSSTACL